MRERSLLNARHRETGGDACECGSVTYARVREAACEERAERRDRTRATGRDHFSDLGRADRCPDEYVGDESLGVGEQAVDEPFEAAARDARVDVDRGMVVREDRRRIAREFAFGGVRGHEDLVSKLQLDRASQGGELALRRALAN